MVTVTNHSHGRPLSPENLERIRREIELFDGIEALEDEICGIVAVTIIVSPRHSDELGGEARLGWL